MYTFSHLIMQISWVADDIVALTSDDDDDGTMGHCIISQLAGRKGKAEDGSFWQQCVRITLLELPQRDIDGRTDGDAKRRSNLHNLFSFTIWETQG